MKKLLIALSALGLAAAGLTSSDIFAPTSDAARAGRFTANSNARPAAVDLQLALFSYESDSCGTFTENLSVELSSTVEARSGMTTPNPGIANICLKNNGATAIVPRVSASILAQNDPACTGEERAFDEDCGVAGTGDLNNPIGLSYPFLVYGSCSLNAYFGADIYRSLATFGACSDFEIPAGGIALINVYYRMSFSGGQITEADFQRAQSDSITFDLDFDASVA